MGFSKITDEAIAELRSRIGKPVRRVTLPTFTEINVDAARHFALAIGDDNPLWLDPDHAGATRWGGQLAPPAILYSTDNVASGAVEGLPSVHAMFAGTDWHWHEPVRIGTKMKTRSTLKAMVEHQTRFAGRSFQQIYTTEFFDQHDTKLAEADSWCFRTERDTAREEGTKYHGVNEQPIVYSEADIKGFAEQYRQEKPRGSEKRLWNDVQDGEMVTPILKGPYTVTAAVAFMQAWGAYAIRNHRMAWHYYDKHPKLAPPNQNDVPEPPVRVHWDNEFARTVGVPGAYDFGPERDLLDVAHADRLDRRRRLPAPAQRADPPAQRGGRDRLVPRPGRRQADGGRARPGRLRGLGREPERRPLDQGHRRSGAAAAMNDMQAGPVIDPAVDAAIGTRRSVRGFTDQPVPHARGAAHPGARQPGAEHDQHPALARACHDRRRRWPSSRRSSARRIATASTGRPSTSITPPNGSRPISTAAARSAGHCMACSASPRATGKPPPVNTKRTSLSSALRSA